MNTTRTMRKPCFKGEDDSGFASIPTNNNNNNNNNKILNRRNSLRNITCSTTTTTLVYSPRSLTLTQLHSPHFLESCSLCRKPLGGNRDIFMYKGDTPFCSEECRQEQIEIDESKEKSWGLKLKMMRTQNETSRSSSKGHNNNNYPVRKSTVAAA